LGVIEVAIIEDQGEVREGLPCYFLSPVRTGALQHHPAQTRGVTNIYVAGKLSEGQRVSAGTVVPDFRFSGGEQLSKA